MLLRILVKTPIAYTYVTINHPKRVENTFSNRHRGYRCSENGRNFKSCLPARMEMSGEIVRR